MSRKEKLIEQLEQAAHTMVQGSLSESSRQCGDPSCACAHDPASRHGPHLYFRYRADGRVHSVYIPSEQRAAIERAQGAWGQFQQFGAEISSTNRRHLLRDLKREKQKTKATKSQHGRKAQGRRNARD